MSARWVQAGGKYSFEEKTGVFGGFLPWIHNCTVSPGDVMVGGVGGWGAGRHVHLVIYGPGPE